MFERLLLDFIARHYREAAHSIFSPSGSSMWMNCPGSLIPNLLAPDEAGAEAAEGTVAHGIAEQWLKTGERPDELIGTTETVREGRQVFEIEITKSMLDYVEEYVDWCVNLPGVHYVEQKVFFSRLTPIPKQGGTADHFACSQHSLVITDLKFGEGVQVFADHNSQALLYALGVFFKHDWLYDFQDITIRIAQPRRDHFDVWETDRKTLLAFAREVRQKASNAWRLNAPLSPSEKACRWCKLKASCPAFAKVADDISAAAFDDIDGEVTSDRALEVVETIDAGLFEPNLPHPTLLTTDQMAKLLPFRAAFETWFAAVEHDLEQRACDGERVAGHKLVEARTHRVFADEQRAVQRLREAGLDTFELYTTKFLSPAQAEELLRTKDMKKSEAVKFLEPVVRKPTGKPTLAPENDKRPAFVAPDDSDVWET